MIFTIIALIIVVFSLLDYKKAFFWYMLFQLIWFPQAKIISIPGLPSIPIYLFTSSAFFFIYLFKYKGKKINSVEFPFLIPLLLMTLARLLSCFTSLSGAADQISRSIGFLFHDFLEIWIMWQIIENEKDFKYLIKGFIIVIFAACLYGLYEYAIQYNPLVEYKSALTEKGINVYRIGVFRGYRMTSFFEHPIGAGMTFGLMAVFIVWLYIQGVNGKRIKAFNLIIAALCLLCVILSKMRAGLFFTIICAFSFVKPRKKRTYTIFMIGSVAIVAMYPFYKDWIDVFLSLFSDSARESVGGSNVQMRITQFEAVSKIMMISPITGLGDQFESFISSSFLVGTYGFESVWFEEMAKHGLLGVITTVIMIVYSVYKVPQKYKKKELFFVSLSYWITYTLTSVPFFRMNLYYFVLIYWIKESDVYKKQFQTRINRTKANKMRITINGK